jgi:hypothetical protein
MLYCPHCDGFFDIDKYDHDNPVLKCGHTKLPDKRIDDCRDDLNTQLHTVSLLLGRSIDELRDDLIKFIIN